VESPGAEICIHIYIDRIHSNGKLGFPKEEWVMSMLEARTSGAATRVMLIHETFCFRLQLHSQASAQNRAEIGGARISALSNIQRDFGAF
jgi:hypothetical protein